MDALRARLENMCAKRTSCGNVVNADKVMADVLRRDVNVPVDQDDRYLSRVEQRQYFLRDPFRLAEEGIFKSKVSNSRLMPEEKAWSNCGAMSWG